MQMYPIPLEVKRQIYHIPKTPILASKVQLRQQFLFVVAAVSLFFFCFFLIKAKAILSKKKVCEVLPF